MPAIVVGALHGFSHLIQKGKKNVSPGCYNSKHETKTTFIESLHQKGAAFTLKQSFLCPETL